MSEPSVDRMSKDIILKLIARAFGGDFFRRFGLDLPPIVDALSVEQPTVMVQTQSADLFLRLANGDIAHFEAQWVMDRKDLGRFASYHLEAYRRHGVNIHTIVLCGPALRTEPEPLRTSSMVFAPTFILLGREQAEAVVATLQAIVARGETLRGVDRISLMLLPLMRREGSLEVILESALSVVESLPAPDRAQTVGAMVGLAYHYLEEGVAQKLLEVLNMPNLMEQMIADRLTQGIEEGRAEGQREMVRGVIRSRFGAVPTVLEERIARLDGEGLQALVIQAATAARIEDL
jgi:hypothetical protein